MIAASTTSRAAIAALLLAVFAWRAAAQSEPDAGAAVDVAVRGDSASDRLRQSAEAVKVVDTDVVKHRSADLGDVLVAIPGVNVRRDGGLGSNARLCLNGLSGDQVRLFLDGLPLDLVGYPFDLASVPVNLIDRIEVYSGVVPIRFGADALGGAVNLVTARPRPGTHGAASYEIGSFDTQRVTLNAQHVHEPSGFFAQLSGLFDYAKNDYPIEVEVPDANDHPTQARVYRFHDAYNAQSANLELGVLDQPWAQRLSLRSFVTRYYKQYQSNLIMTVPYGGLTYSAFTPGASLQYKQPLGRGVMLEAVAGYAYTRGNTLDEATCVYDWFGRCVRPRPASAQVDALYFDHAAFSRIHLGWRMSPQHALRLAIAPNFATRTGSDRSFSADRRDPLSAQHELWTLINGLEYQADLFDQRLENIAFVKQYIQALDGEEVVTSVFKRRERNVLRAGVGDGVRYRLADGLWLKASYEYATRLPSAEEVFGDNVQVGQNLGLLPEVSRNGNLGVTLDAKLGGIGALRAGLNGFVRDVDQLIMLLSGPVQIFQNAYSARSAGIEAELGWTSPHEYVVIDANTTYQDLRNTSDRGTFVKYDGDRIPSQPYLFGNGSVRLQFADVATVHDRAVLFWTARYVHAFFRGWESLGLRDGKDIIPAQFVQTAGIGYEVHGAPVLLTTSVEVQNLTDARVYDYFGAQRPGRALYAKATAEF